MSELAVDALPSPSSSGFAVPSPVISGRYRLAQLLGAGRVASAFAATDLADGERAVVIKMLHAEHIVSPQATARFIDAARSAMGVDDPGVVRVFDAAISELAIPYLVCEHVEDPSLALLLRRGVRFDAAEGAELVRQVAETLEHVRLRGLHHLSVGPRQIFLSRGGEGAVRARIGDFGVLTAALPAEGVPPRVSAFHAVAGETPPELLFSMTAVGAASDVWSLGLLLHELLVGEPPFLPESLLPVAVGALSLSRQPLSTKRPGIPLALSDLVHRCLSVDPRERPRSAGQLARELVPFAVPVDPCRIEVPSATPPPTAPVSEDDLSSTKLHVLGASFHASDAPRATGDEPFRRPEPITEGFPLGKAPTATRIAAILAALAVAGAGVVYALSR